MNIKDEGKIVQEIANRIKQIRIEKGLMQEEVAKRAGLNSNSYSKVERGESKPYGVTLVKIIKALGVKSSDILGV